MSLVLRAQVAAAAHDIVPSWPLDSFIAVNPLAGAESQPFGLATDRGVALVRPTRDYVTDFHKGRIPVEALERALVARVPALAHTVSVGGTELPAFAIAALDMTEHPDSAGTPVAPDDMGLDSYLATWVAAYLNPDAAWAMPHREHGFYRAWRRLAVADPALARTVRRRIAEEIGRAHV